MTDLIDFVTSHIRDTGGNWGTSMLTDMPITLSSPVTHIHCVAHVNEDNAGYGGLSPTNHWSMFLETSPDSSVGLDMATPGNGMPGMILLETRSCNRTERSSCTKTAVPKADTTVANILAMLIEKKRDRYRFVGDEGCRFWLSTVASDLVSEGIISPDDANGIKTSLGY